MPQTEPQGQSTPIPARGRAAASEFVSDRRIGRIIAFLALLILVALCLAGARTALPQGDEAAYANPAYNLAYHGFPGVTVFHLPEYLPLSYGKRMLTTPPGYIYLGALWFRALGMGLMQVRILSLLFACVALAAWWTILRNLLNSETAALAVAAFIATDYYFLLAASHGRPEMVCIGFGMSAIAAYMALRRRSSVSAFFWSHALVTLSILQHPVGLIYWLCLVVIILYLDRRFLSMKTIVTAAVPCICGMALWAAYILPDVPGLREQWPAAMTFNANVFEDQGLSNIGFIRNIQLEVIHRYMAPFGLLPGVNAVNRLKAVILAGYAIGFVGIGVLGWRRRNKELLTIFFLALVSVLYLTFVSPGKFSYYLPHVTPFLAACLGGFLYFIYSGRARTWLVSGALAVLAVIQLGGFLYLVRQDPYHRLYLPAVESIKRSTNPYSLIVGAPEMWFGLFEDRSFVSDPTLGYSNGVDASQFTFDPLYASLHERDAARNRPQYVYVQSLIENAKCVYRDSQYQFFLASPDVMREARSKAAQVARSDGRTAPAGL